MAKSTIPQTIDIASMAGFADIKDGEWEERIKQSDKLQKAIDRLHITDIVFRISSRIIITSFFGILLWTQNSWIYHIISQTVQNGSITLLQPILGVIITGTLGETYLIARIIVEWVFKDIDYPAHASSQANTSI